MDVLTRMSDAGLRKLARNCRSALLRTYTAYRSALATFNNALAQQASAPSGVPYEPIAMETLRRYYQNGAMGRQEYEQKRLALMQQVRFLPWRRSYTVHPRQDC